MPGVLSLLMLALKDVSLYVSYVRNNAFPQPLDAAEEATCIDRMQAGDPEARNRLVEHNLRLVAHLVKKFEGAGEDTEDLISVGTIGLIKAVENYRPNRNTKLATFAARCIDNEILMYLRSNKRHRRDTSLQDSVGVDKEGNELTLVDLLGTDADVVIDQVDLSWEKQKVYAILPALAAREQQVICKRFGLPDGEEMTQREIATQLGISRSYVSRIERRALDKLYQQMRAREGFV